MKKEGMILLIISILLVMPLTSAGEMTTEITGECTVYERGIEYERCCPMSDKINCVSCRDTDGSRDYYTKGETREMHWNRFEMGMLGSGSGLISDECTETIPSPECYGTVIKEATNDTYGLCEFYQRNILYGGKREAITVLREGYCEIVDQYQKYRSEEYECPNGCVDGACVRDDGCPSVIGWRIEGIKCVVDSGCNYDSSRDDYYDSAEECIKGLGKVEYPVLEPLVVPDICSDLLIEKNIKDYNYRETKYSRMGPDIYSEDGKKIGTSQCCVAYYKKSLVALTKSVAYVCPLSSRNDIENSITWWTKEDVYQLGEYENQEVYWMRQGENEALVWTNNNNVLAVADESGPLPDDIAKAYIKKYKSDLGDVDVEIEDITPEPTFESEPINIPEEKMFYSCTGCELEGKCYPLGYRKGGQYCSDNNEFVSQISEGRCDNNFECKSNVCISDECVKEGLIKRIIKWFKKLFGVEPK